MDIMSITYRNLYSEMMTFFIATDHIMIIFKSILWYWANIKYLKFYGVWFWHSLLRWKIFHFVTYRPKLCLLPIQRCFSYFLSNKTHGMINEYEFDLFLKSFEIDKRISIRRKLAHFDWNVREDYWIFIWFIGYSFATNERVRVVIRMFLLKIDHFVWPSSR